METSEANVKKIKKCLSDIIDPEETILEYATVKLSVCSPQTQLQFREFKKEGILCVIINRNNSCLFLKLFDLIELHKQFEIELYMNIKDGYTRIENYFHIIEFPGFFLGLAFPTIDDQNVSNRSTSIHKEIIRFSKFISINLADYKYYHAFDHYKDSIGNIPKNKTFNKKNVSAMYISRDKNNKIDLANKIKFEGNNIDGQNIDSEFDSIRKYKSAGINKSNNNNIKNTESDVNSNNNNNNNSKNDENNSNEEDENDSITVTSQKNYNFGQEKQSQSQSGIDIEIKNKSKKKSVFNFGGMGLNIKNNNRKSSGISLIESKEKNLFDSITVEDNPNDNKIYKIVQFHVLKEDKIRLVKKMYKKNFERFIDPNQISFDYICQYKINSYDFLNEEEFSSEEDELQKTFVDYIPSNDMFGMLENQFIQDERLLELIQQKKNLKEIIKKREDDAPMKTTSVYEKKEE